VAGTLALRRPLRRFSWKIKPISNRFRPKKCIFRNPLFRNPKSVFCQPLPAIASSPPRGGWFTLARPLAPWELELLWSLDVGIWMFILEAYVNLCQPPLGGSPVPAHPSTIDEPIGFRLAARDFLQNLTQYAARNTVKKFKICVSSVPICG
jgi:hypothetical protein